VLGRDSNRLKPAPPHAVASRGTHDLPLVAALTAAALALRLIALLFWADVPGDGPARAMLGYTWWVSPSIPTHGGWPPGFTFLAGIFHCIVPAPAVSTRILNLVLGTATIPLFYLFVRRVYNETLAFASAALLAALPLHIALSATSLSEVSAVFEVVGGALLLVIAAEGPGRRAFCIPLSLLCLATAAMTRYEVWPLIPLFPAYYFLRTGTRSTSALMLAILLAFPLAWMLGNYASGGGGRLLQIGAAAAGDSPDPTIRLHPVDFARAIHTLGRRAVGHLGVVAVAACWGAGLQVFRAAGGRIGPEPALHLVMAGVSWTLMLVVAVARVHWEGDRFLLLSFVLALPLAVLPFEPYARSHRRALGAVLVASILSVGAAAAHYIWLSTFSYGSPLYVTRKQPAEITKVGAWLRQSPYRNDAVLLTDMGGEATYFLLFFPEFAPRSSIVDAWTPGAALGSFLRKRQSSIVISRDEDKEFARIEALLASKAHLWLVHREGPVRVYSVTWLHPHPVAGTTSLAAASPTPVGPASAEPSGADVRRPPDAALRDGPGGRGSARALSTAGAGGPRGVDGAGLMVAGARTSGVSQGRLWTAGFTWRRPHSRAVGGRVCISAVST